MTESGWLRINYRASASFGERWTVRFADLSGAATVDITYDGQTTSERLETGESTRIGDATITVASITRRGGIPPLLSIRYDLD